jgi:DNA-binding NarL/FixJ family response regulator
MFFDSNAAMTTSRESRRMETNVAASYRSDHLSPSEKELLWLVIQGYANKAIALELGVPEARVQVQLKSLLSKIRVLNRTEATVWALAYVPEMMVRILAQP